MLLDLKREAHLQRERDRGNANSLKKSKSPERVLYLRKLRASGMSKEEYREILKKESAVRNREANQKRAREFQRARYKKLKADPVAFAEYKKRKKRYDDKWRSGQNITKEIQACRTIRARIYKSVSRRNAPKFYREDDFLGCTPKKLVEHLESQFDSKMTWDNHGDYWHIDHIRPMASFDLSKREEQLLCSHYTNLQPLKASKNLSKSDKWDGQQEFIAHIL